MKEGGFLGREEARRSLKDRFQMYRHRTHTPEKEKATVAKIREGLAARSPGCCCLSRGRGGDALS